MHYYSQAQFIAQVNENDTIIKPIERWEAHKKGVLHRALTVIVEIKDMVVLQHRRHPVFDGVWDVTVSTHQIYNGKVLEDDMTTIMHTLTRELGISSKDLIQQPMKQRAIHYRAKDPKSKYIEHQVCHVYSCSVSTMPAMNATYAYALTTAKLDKLRQLDNPMRPKLAPWVTELLRYHY